MPAAIIMLAGLIMVVAGERPRWEVVAALLVAGAASVVGARAGRGWLVGLIALTVLTVLAVGSLFGVWFFGLLAVLGVVVAPSGVRGHTEGFGLAALPAVGLVLVESVGGWAAGFEWVGVVALLAAGWWVVVTRDVGQIARAVALGFGGLASVAVWLGSGHAAVAAVVANAMIAPLIGLASMTIEARTGTRGLDWLGGLARGMPKFSWLLMAGLVFAALVPPGPGFVAYELVWHAAVVRGAVVPMLALAVWAPAMGFAAVRTFAMICLGRPRSLRAAAADDAQRPVLIGMALLVAGGVGLGVAGPARLGLLVMVAVLAFGVVRLGYRGGAVEVAGYDDGFARPPAWLPFGDPATQINGSGFAGLVRPPKLVRLRRVVALLGEAMRV